MDTLILPCVAVVGIGYVALKTMYPPSPVSTKPDGEPKKIPATARPRPLFKYVDPALYTASPMDETSRAHTKKTGVWNDPRVHYMMPGGVELIHSDHVPRARNEPAHREGRGIPPVQRPAVSLGPGDRKYVWGIGERQSCSYGCSSCCKS